MPPPRRNRIRTTARFAVEAVSRHPRLGIDYSSVTHVFTDAYVNPRSYAITVEDFPGKTLFIDNTEPEQQRPGSGTHHHRPPDIYRLDCPRDTTGWQFSIAGQPARELPIGPRPPRFTARAATRLVTTQGDFHEERDDNAWNWRINVPGPGTYTVTVERMSGARVNKTTTAELVVQDWLVVSIGDSAASGEGNPDVPGTPEGFDPDLSFWDIFNPVSALFKLTVAAVNWGKDQIAQHWPQIARRGEWHTDMDPDPVWLEPNAHRSLRSGHAYAAQLLEDRDQGRVVTFLPFGRTGADIPNGLIGPRTDGNKQIDGWIGNIGEITEVHNTIGTRRIDALLIYIGTNDMAVASTLSNLVQGDNAILGQGDPTQARRNARDAGLANLAELPGKFDALATALAVLNVGQVYLTEYPTGLFDDVRGNTVRGCEVFSGPQLDLSLRDAELVKDLSERLNTAIATAAARHGWIYVTGIAAAFRGHGYCTPDGHRFFWQCSESLVTQGDTEGTIHPNDLGHTAIGRAVAASVLKNTIKPGRPTQTHGGLGGTVGAAPGTVGAAPGTAGQPGPRSARVPRPRRTSRPAARGRSAVRNQ